MKITSMAMKLWAYQVSTKEDEHVCVREDGEETVVDGGVCDHLPLEPVWAFVALPPDSGVAYSNRCACVKTLITFIVCGNV